MKTTDIHQTILFPTTAADLYNCIMDERIHSSFTASDVIIQNKEGTDFSTFDGYATGKNISLIRGNKIVQRWTAKEEGWPEDHFSEVTFLFNDTPQGCELNLFHRNIPAEKAAAIADGWNEYYWEPLRIYLER